MKGWRRRSNARYTPKVHALSPVVCRRELKDCATHGEQRGDSKEISHALHTSAKILFFFRRANFFHPAFLPVARRDFPPTWKPPPTSPELTRENGEFSVNNGELFAESSQFFEHLAGRRKRDEAESESKCKYSLQSSTPSTTLSGLHAHLLRLSTVPSHAFPSEQQPIAQ